MTSQQYQKQKAFCAHTQEAILSSLDIGQYRVSDQTLSRRIYPKKVLATVLNKETGELMDYKHLISNPKYCALWSKSYRNELVRLAQGISGWAKGTNTIFFIDKVDIPAYFWKDFTYKHIFVSLKPEKADPNLTRLRVGGDRFNYPGYCGTLTTDLLTVKLLLNIKISMSGACFMIINIKDLYLRTPIDRHKYMRLELADLPEDVLKQ